MNIDKEKLMKSISAEEYYADQLGVPEKSDGKGNLYFCKFHDDQKTPNMVVFPDGKFKCFACGEGGDILAFHQHRTGLSFPDVLSDLAQKYASHLLDNNSNGFGTHPVTAAQNGDIFLNKAKPKSADQNKRRNEIPLGEPTARYPYHDKNGEVRFEVLRYEHKQFRQRRPDGKGGWIWNLNGVETVLYRLPELIASTGPIHICEGEKDVIALCKQGLRATTAPMGAGKWKVEYNKSFAGEDVVIFSDNDSVGKKSADQIASSLCRTVKTLKIVNLPGLEEHQDVYDYLAFHTIEDLQSEIEKAEFYIHQKEIFSQEDETWPDPEPIKMDLYPVKPFPLEILPEPFRDWVEDISYRMQCPSDFVAVAVMVLTGSLIGTRCGIKPKARDSWTVIPNLWGGVVGRPSMLKSPALAEALKPMGKLEAQAKEEFDSKVRQREIDQMEYDATNESLKRDMLRARKGKTGKDIDVIKHDLLTLEKPEGTTMRRYRSNDATIEKLSELLNENPTGLLLFRDELVGLLSSWEKQGHESDRAFFLEAWNGDGSLVTDRIGRGTIHTEHLCLSLLGGIQPSKLTTFLLQMNGLQNDGLVQRLQLLVYPDEIKDWQLVDLAPNKQAKERVFSIVDKIANFEFHNVNTVSENSLEFGGIFSLHFSAEAQSIFNEWLTDLELNKLRADDHPLILEHLGKYRSLMPTLALIIHLVDCMDTDEITSISEQAAKQAILWCEYLESHVRRCYGLITDVKQQSAAKLAEKLTAKKLSDRFTVRDVYRQNWHLLNDKELAQSACDELLEEGWLRSEVTPPAFGQKGKVEYLINPEIFTGDS
tara:strand:+ start:2558 stop:5020 length:2463 start_codon:yes stop_codon:yes gene_type:complete